MATRIGPVGPGTPPETDWLTGLWSRAAFGRAVTQADRDRDRFAIALIEIEDFGQVNQRLDYDTGDELLREIGRRLANHASVNTFAARLGGAQFAVLAVQEHGMDLRQWVGPLLAAARDAIAEWTFDLIDYTGECPIGPRLRAGLAAGRSSAVWGRAAVALELAETDPLGEEVVIHDESDPRVAALARRRDLTDRVTAALASGTLKVVADRIEAIRGPEPAWQWLELRVVEPRGTGTGGTGGTGRAGGQQRQPLDRSAMPPGLRRRLDDWLIDRAGRILSEADTQLRLTVPITDQSVADRELAKQILAVVERYRIPTSRILFEVDESAVIADPTPARDLARRLDGIGSGLTVSRCAGGWPAVQALEGLPIHYIEPDDRLLNRAGRADPAAIAILETIVSNAVAVDRQLVAPPTTANDGRLAELGFAYRRATASADITESGRLLAG